MTGCGAHPRKGEVHTLDGTGDTLDGILAHPRTHTHILWTMQLTTVGENKHPGTIWRIPPPHKAGVGNEADDRGGVRPQ